jgi:hypothetical protein
LLDGRPAAEAGSDFHPGQSFFEGLGESFGPRELEISTAGIRVRLTGLSVRQHAEMAARYGIFARPRRNDEPARDGCDLKLSLRRSPREGFLKVRRQAPAETYRLLTKIEGDRLLAWSYEWAALWDRGDRSATLAATTDERVVFDRIIENFLRVVFAHVALEKGALLLHGAGVVRGGSAYVFFGPSGSGKTTVTSLSKGDRILSDDLVMIVPEGRGFAACSVPFRGSGDFRWPAFSGW